MAGVERAEVVEVRVRRAEGGRGEETGRDGVLRVFRDFAEEPQLGRCDRTGKLKFKLNVKAVITHRLIDLTI